MVSTLSQQWYCEKKVDLALQFPGVEPPSPAMEIGTEGHAALEKGATPITREEIEASLQRDERLTLFEFPMEGRWDEIPIWGRPDLVQFEGRSVRLLMEFKFSRRSDLFPSQQTQANLYGWLLQQNHFAIDALLCAVAIFPPERAITKTLPPDLIERLLEGTERLRAKTSRLGMSLLRQEGEFTLHLFPFRPKLAERNLKWAVDYWQGKRAPESNASVNKCRICRFNAEALCDRALSPFTA
ncbi:MAG: hypothetical protein HY282_13930 [Nitrospirae bacterium]|nr:hypothetical protein [Candidatus Manganitrophaceae bacterium]